MLLQDDTHCIFQSTPSNHPERFKCFLEATTPSTELGGCDNDLVALIGSDDCIIIVQSVTWACDGNVFIFESTESLDAVNACFGIVIEITALLVGRAFEVLVVNSIC